MTEKIMGHTFLSLTDGERCIEEKCEGVGSLVELLALDGIAQLEDTGISHTGRTNFYELTTLHDARVRMDARRDMLYSYGRK